MSTRRPATLLALAAACAAMLCASHASAATSGLDYGNAASRVGSAMGTSDFESTAPDPDGFDLKPGQFTWLPASEEASSGSVTLLVSLRDQRGYLYRDGQRIAVTTLSTGVPGHDTPVGVFPITEKKKTHFSNRYNNAPMPWMQRLTQWGHALHAGHVRAGPASHGCVRLPAEFARQLFSLTQRGDLVVITRDVSPRSLAVALAVSDADQRIAPMVGITEELPRIVFVPAGAQPTISAQASSVGTAFNP